MTLLSVLRHAATAAVGLQLTTIAACRDLLPPRLCTLEARPGITVRVQDSITARALADSALAYAVDGSYVETLMPGVFDSTGAMISRFGAVERAGTYTVLVSRVGYAPWAREGVEVVRGPCHVETVELVARLIARL